MQTTATFVHWHFQDNTAFFLAKNSQVYFHMCILKYFLTRECFKFYYKDVIDHAQEP